MRTTTEVIHDHLMMRLSGEVAADIRENYAESVAVLTRSGEYRGLAGIEAAAEELSRLVGDATFTFDQTVISGEYAFLEWSAVDGHRKVSDGADSFVVHDGRIVMQTIHYTPT